MKFECSKCGHVNEFKKVIEDMPHSNMNYPGAHLGSQAGSQSVTTGNITSTNLTQTTARIEFDFNGVFAPARVKYWPTDNPTAIQYTLCQHDSAFSDHVHDIAGLTAGTEYTYQAQSSENDGASAADCSTMTWYDVLTEQTFETSAVATTGSGANFTALKLIIDSSLAVLLNATPAYNATSCVNPNSSALLTSTLGYTNYELNEGLSQYYRVTGDVSYVQHMYNWAIAYINSGVDVDGDGYRDWWNCGVGGYDHEHYDWRAAGAIGTLGNLLREFTTELAQFDQQPIAEFLRDDVWNKYGLSNGAINSPPNTYFDMSFATYMTARMIPAVIFLQNYYGGTSAGTPGHSYLSFLSGGGSPVNQLENHILNSVNDLQNNAVNLRGRVNPTTSGGSDVAGTLSPGTLDVGHAPELITGILYAGKAGYLNNFTAVRTRLANTLHQQMWQPATSDWNFYVNGQSPNIEPAGPSGFFALLEYDARHLSDYVAWCIANIQAGSINHALRIGTAGHLLRADSQF